jgi:hypothetical protein
VYWVGPLAGSILAVLLFKLVKSLEYDTANPDPEALPPAGPTRGARANDDSTSDGATLQQHISESEAVKHGIV